MTDPLIEKEDSSFVIIGRLTALWAFSEAALGGILHAFRIPFKGIFISGSAAILISLIAHFSNHRGAILKSTLLVILIKGLVSPHTPLTAYFAVLLQGIMGELLFFNKSFYRISALLLATITLLFSSVQKILILTIVFGNTLWESIDEFTSFVISKFITEGSDVSIQFSYILIGAYLGLYTISGFFIGLFAGKLPDRIIEINKSNLLNAALINNSISENELNNRTHKRWWKRTSALLLFLFFITIVIVSYIYPDFGSNKAYEIGIMLIRAIVILVLWYTVIGPLLLKGLRKYFNRKKSLYSSEITKIVDTFPRLRTIASHSWKLSQQEKGIRRIKSFITYLIASLLITDIIQE